METSNTWYESNIEEPIREIVKNLRNRGINTFCSCGHGMWIQCETYEEYDDSRTIYIVLAEMKFTTYRTIVFDNIVDGRRDKHIEIMFPDKNGNYYCTFQDNKDFIANVL
jgi:hypothetical protein